MASMNPADINELEAELEREVLLLKAKNRRSLEKRLPRARHSGHDLHFVYDGLGRRIKKYTKRRSVHRPRSTIASKFLNIYY